MQGRDAFDAQHSQHPGLAGEQGGYTPAAAGGFAPAPGSSYQPSQQLLGGGSGGGVVDAPKEARAILRYIPEQVRVHVLLLVHCCCLH